MLSTWLMLAVLLRFGFLAAGVLSLVAFLMSMFPITFDFGRWYAPAGVWAMTIAAGLLAWGLWVALRPARAGLTGRSN